MPEEETEGTRHAPRLVKAVPLFRRLSWPRAEKSGSLVQPGDVPAKLPVFFSQPQLRCHNGCVKRRRELVKELSTIVTSIVNIMFASKKWAQGIYYYNVKLIKEKKDVILWS